jgi:Flp pilus assembly protein TadB
VSTAAALLAGAGFGLGVVLLVEGCRRRPAAAAPPSPLSQRLRSLPRVTPRLLAALAGGLVVAVVTGWPVAGLLAGLGVVWLPGLLGPDRDHHRSLARVEALAGWCELLRDTLSAAAGLQQTIQATAATAPTAIRPQVSGLAAALARRVPPARALRAFADELADPTGDLVVAALLLAAWRPTAQLGQLLGALAGTAREQAAMRARVAASRARVRTSTRVITATTLVMLLLLVVFNRDWLVPYDTAQGQLVLLVAGGLFTAGFAALHRMSQVHGFPRLLGGAR